MARISGNILANSSLQLNDHKPHQIMIALGDRHDLSPEEYLELEAKNATKHEYIDGKVYAMAEATDTNNTICGNLYSLLRNHLMGSNYRIYAIELKVRIDKKNCFYSDPI